jgi:hypothetical protein
VFKHPVNALREIEQGSPESRLTGSHKILIEQLKLLGNKMSGQYPDDDSLKTLLNIEPNKEGDAEKWAEQILSHMEGIIKAKTEFIYSSYRKQYGINGICGHKGSLGIYFYLDPNLTIYLFLEYRSIFYTVH